FAAGEILCGYGLFLVLRSVFASLMLRRASHRKDIPPPGYVLVGLAFLSVFAGTVLAVVQPWSDELDYRWVTLQRLLSYQGFVLLPILGIGPFILPRFFGLPSPHDFPVALVPPSAWKKKAALALGAGVLIEVSFLLEARGWFRAGHAIRFVTTLAY